MKTKDRKEIKEITTMLAELDERDLVLIKNGATLLRDRQVLENDRKGAVKK